MKNELIAYVYDHKKVQIDEHGLSFKLQKSFPVACVVAKDANHMGTVVWNQDKDICSKKRARKIASNRASKNAFSLIPNRKITDYKGDTRKLIDVVYEAEKLMQQRAIKYFNGKSSVGTSNDS